LPKVVYYYNFLFKDKWYTKVQNLQWVVAISSPGETPRFNPPETIYSSQYVKKSPSFGLVILFIF